MASGVVAETMTVADALRTAYADLVGIRQELHDWWSSIGPRRGPDNTYRNWRVYEICQSLDRIEAPDLAAVTVDVLGHEICAVVSMSSRSRETRKVNALAKLRPAAAALQRAGLSQIAEKVVADISRVAFIGRIPGAYE